VFSVVDLLCHDPFILLDQNKLKSLKVKTVIDMSNVSLLLRKFQTSFLQELFNQLGNLLCGLF